MSFNFRKTGNPVALPAPEREYAPVSGGARVTEVLKSTTNRREVGLNFSAQAEKGKSTSVLKTVHLQPGAKHPVCMARNHF